MQRILGSVLLLITTSATFAQDTASGSTVTVSTSRTFTTPLITGTPSYVSYASTETVSLSSSSFNSTSTTSDAFPTLLVGTNRANSTATSTAAAPINTQPCNGHVAYCNRKYSNITMVAAHNSPFAIPDNAASNQAFGLLSQLNDGVRMLQGQAHMVSGVLHYCHTSCDLLDAGPVETYLANATEWLRNHPFEVLTILIGNAEFLSVNDYVAPIRDSGLEKFLYVPTKIPMALDDWPTLGELILAGTRAVLFMDYDANQTSVPYILDEFSQLWETPFSPTDPNFPCTQQRPPGLSDTDASRRMYMANHNLNVNIQIGSLSLLLPNVVSIDNTNSNLTTSVGALGETAVNCTAKWGRPPNFLLVDYYNRGNFNGSVFAVAAEANGVDYDPAKEHCCGKNARINAGGALRPRYIAELVITVLMALVTLML